LVVAATANAHGCDDRGLSPARAA